MSIQGDRLATWWLDHMPVVGLERKAIGCFSDAIRTRVMTSVRKAAQEQEVVEVGSATECPVLVVMGFGAVGRHAATGKAEAVSHVERQAQPVRHHALFATDVDRQPIA